MRIFVTKKIQKLNWQGKNEGLKMRIVPDYKTTGKDFIYVYVSTGGSRISLGLKGALGEKPRP